MYYRPLEITNHQVSGIGWSLRAMRLPKKQNRVTSVNEDLELAAKLVKAGPDHAKFARGIVVHAELTMQIGWMLHLETYNVGVTTLSTTSAMHNELCGLSGVELAEKKQAELPERIYTRSLTMNYQALRNIYRQRRNHAHPDWTIFCDWVETLPHFEYLIFPAAA